MSKIDDGGPAFPSMKYTMLQTGAKQDDYDAAITGQGAKVTHYELSGYGMTLRDYFAAKAMQRIVPPDEVIGNMTYADVAQAAEGWAFKSYIIGEAMLKARAEK